jgi:two-component system nitrate/nitrite response regulator NarL
MSKKIRVAILDDHQSIVDGYLYRLQNAPDIEVVATAVYGEA